MYRKLLVAPLTCQARAIKRTGKLVEAGADIAQQPPAEFGRLLFLQQRLQHIEHPVKRPVVQQVGFDRTDDRLAGPQRHAGAQRLHDGARAQRLEPRLIKCERRGHEAHSVRMVQPVVLRASSERCASATSASANCWSM